MIIGLLCFLSTVIAAPKPDILIIAGRLTPQQATSTEPYQQTVYTNKALTQQFDLHRYPSTCCVPNNLTVFRANLYTASRESAYTIPFTIVNTKTPIEIIGITVSNYYHHQQLGLSINDTPMVVSSESRFTVSHTCRAQMTTDTYWTVVEVFINLREYQAIRFQYQFLCDGNYHPSRFDWSSVILVILATISISSLARFGKLYSFKVLFRKAPRKMTRMATGMARVDEHIFQGFFLTWYNALVYVVVMTAALALAIKYQDRAERIEERIVLVVASLMTLHFVDECLCQLKELKTRIFWRVRTRHLYSIFLSFLVIFAYWFWDKPWFISDLISICMLGSLSKIYKFICMKDSVNFLLPCMIVDILLFIYVVSYVRYEWDSVAMRYFDTPLFFQLPYVHYIYKKKCAWVSIINILFPGFFIGLAYRFDQCKGTLVYEIISFSGLLLGMMTWLIVQSVYSLPLPVSLFTEIPMISLCTYFAWRRTEIRSLWFGVFYDSILLEPFKNQLLKQGRDSVNSVISVGLFAQEIEMKPVEKSRNSEYDVAPLVRQTASGHLNIHSGLFEGLLAKI